MRAGTRGHRVFRPQLERLEARDCPAFNIYYHSSVLLIQGHVTLPFVNPGDGLQLNYNPATNRVSVDEVGGAKTIHRGAFAPPRTIEVALDYNTDHDFTLNLGGGRMPSNFILNLGKGNTDVLSINSDNIVNGTLGGNLLILGGVGGENINLGDFLGATPVTIQGDTTLSLGKQHTPIGGDFFTVQPGAILMGNLIGNQVDNIQIGEFGAPATVRKNVSLNVAGSKNVGKFFLVAGEVDGNVTFQGSPFIDPIFSDSVIVGDTNASTGVVIGNVSAVLGNGTGDFEIDVGSVVNGNVTLTGALGDDDVGIDGSVLGSVQMNLRSGNNTLEFGQFALVQGDMSVSADNGDNDLTNFNGTVNGNLSFLLGNGDNSLTIANAPGGQLRWTSGNGSDTVTLAPATDNQVWNVFIQFGTAPGTLNLAGSGNNELLSGQVSSDSSTGNTFNQGGNWILLSSLTFINFP
jgi:hypothetical protein